MVHSKLPNVGTSIFAVMSQMAQEHDAINLSQGFPDFPVSPQLIELVAKHMREGRNQYAPMQGLPELREAIARKMHKHYGAEYSPDTEINITSGATQAIFSTISAFINEGDEVLIFEPAYDSYVPAIRLNGGKPVFVQMQLPDYKIDWEQVKKAINAQTKMIILNSPHNPTGSTLSEADVNELKRIVAGSKIMILSDEVYEHMVFDGKEHQSLARFPELRDRTLVVSSFGKTFHATGWKVGYIAGPAPLIQEFRKIHQFQVFTVNTPIQYAIAEFLAFEEEYLGLPKFYEQKRDFFADLLKDTPFKLTPSEGTYFQNVDFSELSDAKDVDFAEWLTQEVGVAAIPLSSFYHGKIDNHKIRFCFAKSEETLSEAVDRLKKLDREYCMAKLANV